MRISPAIKLTPDQQSIHEAQARSRSRPARVVERSRIVLLAAEGKQDKEISGSLSMTPKNVSLWRKRFLQLGLADLEKDAPRSGRTPTPYQTGRRHDHTREASESNPLEHSHDG